MFKIQYNVGGLWYDYNFLFQTEWAANVKAHSLHDAMHIDIVIVEVKTNLVIAHYFTAG